MLAEAHPKSCLEGSAASVGRRRDGEGGGVKCAVEFGLVGDRLHQLRLHGGALAAREVAAAQFGPQLLDNRAFCADCQCTGPVGVVFTSCSTALVIRRQVAAPSRSPSVSRLSARVALSLGALSPKRLSITSAARQISISGITGRNSECAIRERLPNAGDTRERGPWVKCCRC
jgi:hypothetical protein